jgi:two-component system, LytTR family, sensor kinase
MAPFWKYKIDHIIFWTATVAFHMFTRLGLITTAGVDQFLLEIVVRNGLLACVVYLNLLVLIPFFARQQKVALYVLLLCISLFGYGLLKNVHDVYVWGMLPEPASILGFLDNTFYNLSIAVFYVAFSVALQLSREWFAQRELIRKIEVEKLNTELEYLKAQINPHFLFNSINTIYFQIDKHNQTARDTLSAFSDMLRYQLYECNGKEVAVEKEVNYLKNYVGLQRVRKDENYSITFSASDDVKGFSIAPLLLIPFVENAFKHVSHYSKGNDIGIYLSRDETRFYFRVFNTKDNQKQLKDGGGIGFRNVQRRLELIYNGRHTLEVKDLPASFQVELTLQLN